MDAPAERRALDARRLAVTFTQRMWNQDWHVSVGFFPNRQVGEVFIAASKTPGTDLDASCRDCAILLSLCLQYGCPLDVISHAITRNADGSPSSIAGAVIDVIKEIKP